MSTIKNPNIPIRINSQPYDPSQIWYVANEKAYKAFCRKLKIKNPVEMHWDAQGCVAEFVDGKYQAIYIRDIIPGGVCHVAAVVAHECVHLWQNLKTFIEEDKPGEEVEAYCIDHFVEQVLKAFLDTTVELDNGESTISTVDSGSTSGTESTIGAVDQVVDNGSGSSKDNLT